MMINFQTKNSAFTSNRLKQNDYYYKYIHKQNFKTHRANLKSSDQLNPRLSNQFKNFIPYHESKKPSVE